MSVIIYIPTKNAHAFISETLESLEKQTVPVRLVIGDNGSTDDTLKLVRERFKKFEIIEHGPSLGLGKSLNRAFKKLSECEFLFICHADDIYASTFIADSLKIFKRSPSIAMVHSKALIIGQKGQRRRSFKNLIRNILNFLFPRLKGSWGINMLLFKNSIVAPSAGFRSSMIANERFGEDNNFLTDLVLWTSILKSEKHIAYNSRVGIYYRVHENQQSGKYKDDKQRTAEYTNFLKNFASDLRPTAVFSIKLNIFLYKLISLIRD